VNILLLGGTADARILANRCFDEGLFNKTREHRLIYSVAGLVRQPDVPCEVISGGFTQYGGLAHYIESHYIDLVLDMTHPYAKKMSETAVDVCGRLSVPCLRFVRKAWSVEAGDRWVDVQNWDQVCRYAAPYRNILLSVGQVSDAQLQQLKTATQSRILLRTAATPRITLHNKYPDEILWVKGIGPFDYASELQLLTEHQIDLVVSKNSGGESTYAKIAAARQLGVPVVMMQRPTVTLPKLVMNDLESCLTGLKSMLQNYLPCKSATSERFN
jgi:precorrin-6A/cobalt-precorrin-6A reductase